MGDGYMLIWDEGYNYADGGGAARGSRTLLSLLTLVVPVGSVGAMP